jgi:hypothetical protein
VNDTQRDGASAALTVCFFLPVVFFFGRTTFIGSGAAEEFEVWPDSWYGGNEDVDASATLGARLFVEDDTSWGRWAALSGISPSRSTTKAAE